VESGIDTDTVPLVTVFLVLQGCKEVQHRQRLCLPPDLENIKNWKQMQCYRESNEQQNIYSAGRQKSFESYINALRAEAFSKMLPHLSYYCDREGNIQTVLSLEKASSENACE
jgi:hypothetical protein